MSKIQTTTLIEVTGRDLNTLCHALAIANIVMHKAANRAQNNPSGKAKLPGDGRRGGAAG